MRVPQFNILRDDDFFVEDLSQETHSAKDTAQEIVVTPLVEGLIVFFPLLTDLFILL